ncbi:MAG: sucrase ferredoxin, partial [Cyanobacteria bacterium P01_F01_bin.4]
MSSHALSTTIAGSPRESPCRYCSVVSKANGEDPIGTAVTAAQWLFIEVPQPWAKDPWQGQSPESLEVFQLIEQTPRLWQQLRIVAIAPDKVYSQPGHCHVFFYRKPEGLVA